MLSNRFRTGAWTPVAWFLAFLFMYTSQSVTAQSAAGNGRIEGTVADVSGAALPAASISAVNVDTGIAAEQKSDSLGHFLFLALQPGKYRVTVQKEGFRSAASEIEVAVGTTASLQPRLSIHGVDTTISVTGEAPLVDTTQSSMSTVVDRNSIQNLPLNGRNFTDFVLLTPGASSDGDFGMITFNGVAGNFNNYMVDGANDNNAFFSQQIGRTSIPFQFSEDVIQEFQVTNTGFEAEFGQAGGGVVNSVTRSGGNQFHADTYYYALDSALNANDAIDKENGIAKPHDRRQQFGVTAGGPIKHDRLFYLGNYEGQVRNEPLTVNNSPAFVNLPAGFLASNPAVASQIQQASGSFPRSFNQNTGFFKLSGLINDHNTFDATYNYQRFRSPHGYFSTPTSTGDGLSLTDGATSQFAQFTVHTTWNSTTLNELRFHVGFDTHFDLPATPPTGPAITIQNPDTGFVFGGNRFQLSTSDHRYEIANNFTKVLGRHTLKAGVDINVNDDRDFFIYGPKGEYRFADLQSVATGDFELYLQSFGKNTANIRVPTFSLFAQDEFRATSRLNLNYGLRWDLQALAQPGVCNPDFTLTCNIHYSKANLAPRVGFAYSLGQNRDTVIRSSFGIFYMQEDLLDLSQASLSNGISQQFLVTTGPGFGNTSPIVTFPTSLTSFPSGAGGTPSLVVFSPNFRMPYVEQANLAVEHQFGRNTSVSLGYVYTHGLQLLGNSNGVTRQANGNFGADLNLVPPSQQTQPQFGGAFTSDTVTLPNGKTFTVPDFEAIDGFINPNFGPINVIDNTGKSVYHGLQASVRHHSRQFEGGLAYTWSKTIDQGTGYFNQFDITSQRGLSQIDQPQRLVLNGAWMPQWHYAKGFMLSSVATFASGRPYTAVFDSSQLNFSIVPGEGYNSFRGPGVQDFDLRLSRTFRVRERVDVNFGVEAFDLFNHPNFQQSPVDQVQYTTTQLNDASGNPTNAWTADANPQFGRPLAIAPRNGSRNLQFSTRVSF